jgi:hypothetical protein
MCEDFGLPDITRGCRPDAASGCPRSKKVGVRSLNYQVHCILHQYLVRPLLPVKLFYGLFIHYTDIAIALY